MIKSTHRLILAVLTAGLVLSFAPTAHAATPYLSVSNLSGGSSNTQITVSNANSYSQINLFTRQSSTLWTEIRNIGQTDNNGYFTQVINLPTDGTASQIQLYVTASGLQSNSVSVPAYGGTGGCTYNCGSPYGISLSQNNLNLTQGQNSSVSIYNAGSSYGTFYISSNSNSNVASAYISGSTVYVNALNSGNTNISICQNNNSSSCVSLNVTVTGGSGCSYYGCGSITLSQANLNLNVGQSAAVNITNSSYSVSFYISSNSNSNVASAYISGSTIYVNALNIGSTLINICQNNSSSSCTSLYVLVSGNSQGNSGNVWFSPSNPTLNVGQSLAVAINSSVSAQSYSYYSNVYYISSNSNPNVVSANISGTTLNLSGLQSGSSSLNVCHSSISICGTVYVTVSGYSNYSNLSLSQTNLNLNAGQTATVTIYGSGYYYISSNTNQTVASASVSGNTITVYGNQYGATNISICQNNPSACGTLSVNVSGYSYGGGGLQYPGGGNVLGSNVYPNGQLISENGTVYIVYKNTKTGFASASVFQALGFKFSNVLQVGQSNLNNSGYIVSSQYTSHPWGSWIKSGQTVYFVHESGLIPVPSWEVFLNNGGQSHFIVPANSGDFTLPILASMASSDSRLR